MLVAALAAGAFGSAPAAFADVSLTPSAAIRGDGVNVTFEVPTERADAHTTKVEIYLPEQTPIAEVFPLSVPEWAPQMTHRKLATPLQDMHGGLTREVVSAVIWTRVVPPSEPNEVVRLPISIGPLPETDNVAFTVVQTYSDGAVVRWDGSPERPAPTLTLRPMPAMPEPPQLPEASTEPSDWSWAMLGGGLAVGAGLAAGGWFIARSRRAGQDQEPRWRLPDSEEQKEPADALAGPPRREDSANQPQ